jgi:hypothetical protein
MIFSGAYVVSGFFWVAYETNCSYCAIIRGKLVRLVMLSQKIFPEPKIQ